MLTIRELVDDLETALTGHLDLTDLCEDEDRCLADHRKEQIEARVTSLTAEVERLRRAIAETMRRAELPTATAGAGLPSSRESLDAAISRCVRLAIDHVTEPIRAALSPPTEGGDRPEPVSRVAVTPGIGEQPAPASASPPAAEGEPEDWCAANCPESTPVCDGAPCAAPASPSVDILAIDLPQGPMPPREALGPAAPDDVLSPCPQNFSALGRLLALGQKAPPDPDAEPAEPPPLNIVARAAHLLAGKGPKEPVCVCGHPHGEDGLCHASFDDERSYLPVKCGCTTFRPAPGKEPKP